MQRYGVVQARTVAFASIIFTQLAQTLEVGRSEGRLTPSVTSAVVGSTAVLLMALMVPTLRTFLNLTALSPFGWMLIGAGGVAALGLSHMFS